ncbi:MAG TPA: ABC transporter ATP-binding protein, partial [Burkholderiaceae bacterium]|nr:ABC transporter ATP-binding protein [Burkholderiaceae bacterium]
MMAAALSLQAITCTFISRDDRTQRYTAVRDVSLDVAPGEFVSVVGPTGCGKSTLLNVGAGLLEPSSGSVHVFGEPLVGINRRAGYMFQSEALMPWRTTRDNVLAGLQFRGLADSEAARLADDWLQRVGLAGFGDRYPHQLSGGMRKRTSLAQTLVLDPDIILMDEPFSALDIQTRQLMENELLEIWAGGGDARRAAPSKSPAPAGGGREAA